MNVSGQSLAGTPPLSRPRLTASPVIVRRRALGDAAAWVLLLWALLLALAWFFSSSDQFQHWFVLPLLLCGVLIGSDALLWFRGRCNVFDPVGLLGVFGLHFFFLAPLLHVYWGSWMLYITPPPDWRDWLGAMAFLNLLGVVIYRWSSGVSTAVSVPAGGTVWRLHQRRFTVLLTLGLVISGVLQLLVYASFGGFQGYVQAFEDAQAAPLTTSVWRGLGPVFMFSESFPILAALAFATYARNKPSARSWLILGLALAVFFILKLLFGGLRGSRSNTIYGVFWAVGLIHFWLRPLPRKAIAFGCATLLLFVYVYGFYKAVGRDAVTLLGDDQGRATVEESRGRTLQGAVVGDLGRADVQAFVLYRLLRPESDYDYALGRTYLGGVALIVPRGLWPNRPLSKVVEGTEVQFGRRTYVPDEWEASQVYGLAGEAMLNFGPLAAPLSFALLGLLASRIRRLMNGLPPSDSRWLLMPFLISLCPVLLVSDSDNIVFYLFKDGLVPFLVVALSSEQLAAARALPAPLRQIVTRSTGRAPYPS